MTVIACPIVQVGKTAKHPNADSLSLTHVAGNCCIFRTGEFEEGQRAVFIPEEALVPDVPQFVFLWYNRIKENKPVREKDRVVKAKKLRGIFSCGLLQPVPADHENDPTGTDLVGHFGITKYEAPEQVGSGGDNASTPGWLPKFTDIENAKGFLFNQSQVDKLPEAQVFSGFNPNTMRSDMFKPGEPVVITEKIHGANARYAYHDGQFIIGSHTNVKANDSTNWWTHVAKKLDMEARCKKCPGYILFGEVYGQVQKGYEYGLKAPTFVLFHPGEEVRGLGLLRRDVPGAGDSPRPDSVQGTVGVPGTCCPVLGRTDRSREGSPQSGRMRRPHQPGALGRVPRSHVPEARRGNLFAEEVRQCVDFSHSEARTSVLGGVE